MKVYVKASKDSGMVGIWWYTPNKEIWAKCTTLDHGESDGSFIHYSMTNNHLNLWRAIVRDNVKDSSEAEPIINKGYKSYERGRVVFNLRTQCYEILCSKTLFSDESFRESCIKYFGLEGCRRDFISSDHYFVAELTGNPELDKFTYEEF